MKRKALLILLLIGFFMPWAANAQIELLSENFDGMSSISTSYSETGWYAYNAGNGNNWTLNTTSSYAHSGSNSAQVQYHSSNDANCYLVSAPFTTARDMTELTVNLYDRSRSASYTETYDVFFVTARDVTDLAGVATATQYSAISSSTNSISYTQKTGTVTDRNLAGQSVRVVVHCTSPRDQWYLYIDDITVSQVTSDPYITLPANITVFAGFTETITAIYGNVTDTPRITYSSSNTRVATVTGEGTTATVTGVSVGTATITATMEVEGREYTADCTVTVESPSYCTPSYSYTGTNYGMFIDGFSTQDGDTDINNASTSLGTGGYSDYYNSFFASAEAGQTINFTVTPGATVNPMKYSMWIDWNQDFDFNDAGENVAIQNSAIQSNWTGTISIPATTPQGSYRIRIEGMYSNDVNLDPCVAGTYGEAEDYQLIVQAASSCPKPSNVQVTVLGNEITTTWEGDASSYNIDINGTVTANVTSPYVFTGTLATEYIVKVQAVCSTSETSQWTNPRTVTTENCLTEDQCLITITLTDSYGDGGGSMYVVDADTDAILGEFILSSGSSQQFPLYVCHGTNLDFYFFATDNYAYENGYSITDANGDVIAEHTSGTAPTDGVVASYTMNCSGCNRPSELQETQVGTNSAVLNWTGDNNSYVLQYRTSAHDNMNLWEQVGNDIIGTGILTQYSFDLSSFSGTGNIAIRHYNVSDMFRVAIDDIVVTDANGTEVINEGFESSVPSDWQGLDYDGDGNGWARVSFSDEGYQNGDYCMSSESWQSGVGALTPDNWLIIPDVELGGTLTFYMRGVDPSFPQENIGVFVTSASLDVVFSITPAGEWSADITTTDTEYELTGLTAGTAYEWQVKGICGDTESSWASSSFTTIAEGFKTFITAGDWDVDANWFPEGVPTIEDQVSIEAAATIPAGVVATAKRVDLTGGSILIKDGGQLKQGAATLRVTMEKEITGYGTSDGNYYFIASPFSGRTLYQESGTWSRVDNLFDGDYDLYAFDATAEDGLEWINYKSSPTHISFQSDNGNDGLMYGEGYLYANQAGTTLTFVGTTGKSIDYSETIDYTFDSESTDDWNGWKLVGNFFSCNGYISYVDANGEALDADFYTLNSDNTYTLMSSNQPLPPCTGALINYSATGKVQYATEAPEAKASGMLNMTVTQGRSNVDQARIRFGQGYNLAKMSFRNSSKLYIQQNGNDYAVVRGEAQGEMPVSFKAESNGTYTLSFCNENVEFGYLHLIDNLTGNDVDLLANPSYSFEAKTTDYANRFKLVFSTGNATDDHFAFISNGELIVNGEGTLRVFDVLGRSVLTQDVTTANCQLSTANFPAGVYMIQLVNGDNTKTQKIVVK